MTDNEMVNNLWPHPTEDTDHDGQITFKEGALYVLKMIPWTIFSILLPTLKWAASEGVKEFLPLAVGFVRDIAISSLTGNEKKAVVVQQLKDAAAAQGVTLATRSINRLIETALAQVEAETL